MTRRKLFALFASLPLVGRLVPKPEGLRWSATQEMLEDDRYGVVEALAQEPFAYRHYVYGGFLADQAQQRFHATLAEALEHARPGDDIVIAEGHQEHKDS